MPGLDGIAATEALLPRRPGSRVVLVTVHDEPELMERGYAAGALAYVAKLSACRDLVPAVRAALRDERYLPSDVAQAPTRAPPGHPRPAARGADPNVGASGGPAHEPGSRRRITVPKASGPRSGRNHLTRGGAT